MTTLLSSQKLSKYLLTLQVLFAKSNMHVKETILLYYTVYCSGRGTQQKHRNERQASTTSHACYNSGQISSGSHVGAALARSSPLQILNKNKKGRKRHGLCRVLRCWTPLQARAFLSSSCLLGLFGLLFLFFFHEQLAFRPAWFWPQDFIYFSRCNKPACLPCLISSLLEQRSEEGEGRKRREGLLGETGVTAPNLPR